MNVGYMRVSTVEQDTALQLAAMGAAGVEKLFEEKRSAVAVRPVLEACVASLERGDILCVYKIDRLARSLFDLMGLLRRLDALGVGFRSLTEPIETATPAGRLMVQILGSFAEFERAVIKERCSAGRVEAVRKGVKFGRPSILDKAACEKLSGEGVSNSEIARRFSAHPSSVSRLLSNSRRGRLYTLSSFSK